MGGLLILVEWLVGIVLKLVSNVGVPIGKDKSRIVSCDGIVVLSISLGVEGKSLSAIGGSIGVSLICAGGGTISEVSGMCRSCECM